MNITLRALVSLHHVTSLSALAIIASARLASVCAQAPELEVERGALINGTRLPALEVTRGELNAFAWLHPAGSPQEVTCSGALITPIHLLTAAHCMEPYSFRGFGVGFGAENMAGLPYALIVEVDTSGGKAKVSERKLVDHGPGALQARLVWT